MSTDRLLMMIRVVLNSPTLVDRQGYEWMVTGFDKDERAILSRVDDKPRKSELDRGPRVVGSLKGYTVKPVVQVVRDSE